METEEEINDSTILNFAFPCSLVNFERSRGTYRCFCHGTRGFQRHNLSYLQHDVMLTKHADQADGLDGVAT